MNPAHSSVPNRARTTVLTLVVPLIMLAASVAWVISMLPALPDPVATHWGANGSPNGFGSATSTIVLMVVLVASFTIGMWAIGFFLGSSASTRRLAAFLSVWFAVMMGGLLAGSLAMQRGLADATDAPGVGVPMAISIAAASVLGTLAALAVRPDPPQPTTVGVPDAALRLPLAAGEQAVRVRTVDLPRLGWVTVGGAAVTVVLGGLTMLAGIEVGVVTLIVSALVTLSLVLLGRWTITVDHVGLSATSVLPRPRVIVPLDEVELAEVTDVQPLADFGGWGYRIDLLGRVGIVVRAGEAILVRRTGGRQVVVTVDDAATGAALLNTLADRGRRR